MEVVLADDYFLLAVLDALYFGTPAACCLQCGFDCFGTCVHGENHFFACKFAETLIEITEHCVVECARSKSYFVELFFCRSYNLRVQVSEIVGRVCGKHVIVFASLGIFYYNSVRFDYYNVFWVIVMCAEFVGLVDDLLC